MKIIKRVPWGLKFTCSGCKSELECEAEDVKYGVSGMDADGGYYCDCAVCGQQKDLGYGRNIPSSILNKAVAAFDKRNRGR